MPLLRTDPFLVVSCCALQGCGITGNAEPARVGDYFNQLITGGVYALEWRVDNYIRAFYFERDNVPADLAGRQSPDPDSWGKPYVRHHHIPALSSLVALKLFLLCLL